jgi:hypothetical protein
MHITGFVEKRLDGVAQRTTEFFWLQRSNHPILEPFEDIIRELVEVPAVPAIESSVIDFVYSARPASDG